MVPAVHHPPENGKIWVFWWSGEDAAPDIVKACIRSIRENANGHEVIFLDKDTYSDYVSIPESVQKKHNEGIIGHAHYFDLIRLSLLAQYGGMWIDATVFLSQPIPSEIFSQPFYSLKTYTRDADYISKSRWCGYFLAGSSDFPLFSFTRDCLIAYWERRDVIIDYLLMDYIFALAYEHMEEVKKAIDSLCDNNTKHGTLMSEINAPYSEELFNMLRAGDTFASKLSWRYGNPVAYTSKGELTNYGYLLSLK